MFLLIFFGIIILFQLIGIVMRGFKVTSGQIIGLSIGIFGYGMIFFNYMGNKKNDKK
jgi:hypothetical protein